jgi:uncharacterized membrane protein YgcG
MKPNRKMWGVLALVGLLLLAMTSVSRAGLFDKDETVGERFRKAIEKIRHSCGSRKLAPGEVCGEVAKLEPVDPLATEEGKFAHSIRIPNPVPEDSGYKPGMTSKEYFDHLCKTEAGEFIYKTVENVEGIFMMRPRREATDWELEHLYVLEDPYGYVTEGSAETGRELLVRPGAYVFLEERSPDLTKEAVYRRYTAEYSSGKKTSFEIAFPKPNEEPPAELGTLRDLLKATGNPTTLEKIQRKHLGPKLQAYVQDQAERLAQEHADVARAAPRFLAGPGARSWIASTWPFLALTPALLAFPFQGETISISGAEAEYAIPATAIVVVIALVDSLVAAAAFRYALNVRLDLQNKLFQHLDGLKLYLGVAEKDRLAFHNAPEKNPQLFEKLLPYAIALGVEEAWAAAFKDILSQPPDWYHGSDTFSASAFASSMHSFSTSAAASVASFPQSSGTGSSGSGGGGSSGGGGGGGGGGSW